MLDVAANRFFRIKSNLLLQRESGWNPNRIPDGHLGRQTLLFNLRSQYSDAEPSAQDVAKPQSSDAGGPLPLRFRLKSDNDPMPMPPLHSRSDHMSRRDLLELIRRNIYSDICGPFPYYSLNYFWITRLIMSLFMMFEDELKRLNNPLYHEIYVANGGRNPEKRVFLTAAA